MELQAERIMDPRLKTRSVAIISSTHSNGSIVSLSPEAKEEGLSIGMKVSLIKKSGAAGCVCSAKEAKIIRKKYKNLFIVTPGIRLPGDKTNDQARVETPAKAFNNKVSAIVIGRSLVSGKIKDNLKRLINHLN